ncbi:MAG: DNA-binding LytR/AlgR family response regulator [Nonlabens sp.]|jgi:DNA-binding LytR/AlgR family response regulator|uniref:LytR/AlgR family response regulator transcription factor n=1 Tax=Nonlabens sp. TaxID=1888209 RepID=UPI0039E54950
MKTIIIEDEKPSARRLNRMLEVLNITPDLMLHSVHESVEYLLNNPAPDLIFLDIQLSDGLSFEIFDQVEIKSAIIFTTAYDEYALQAFKLNSIDYLLKPIDEEELMAAVDQFRLRFRQSQNSNKAAIINFEEIAKLLGNPIERNYKKRYTARVGEHLKLFHTDDVQLFYSENKGTYLSIENGRNYLIDTKLESLLEELDPKQFFRISRQAIIHIKAIDDMISYTNSRIQIKINSFKEFDLIVSRERVKEFRAWLEK